MIHELRIYTVKPGKLQTVIDASGTVGQRIRATGDFGTLEGHFGSEIGRLNQYIHLWSYDSVDDMRRKRAELSGLEAWRTEFGPLMQPHIIEQTIRLLDPVIAMKTPATEGNLYELRTYTVKVGRAVPWCALMAEHLHVREKYSMNCGLWTTISPDPNQVVHLWAYESFEQRQAVRAQSQADPEWQAFLAEAGPQIETMDSMLLLPSAYSPRK
jgi:hypothetical protein